MTKEEFYKALDEHKTWLDDGAVSASKGKKLSLNYEVIEGEVRGFDFAYAIASSCIFRNVKFIGCKFPSLRFEQCSFCACEFRQCSFNNSDFQYSLLYNCDFFECVFNNVCFLNASIAFTDYSGCKLFMCNFRSASIRRSSFMSSGFEGDSRLEGASIEDSDLPQGYERILGRTLKEPIIGYKKTREGIVIKAEIPAGAIVFSINGNKCRTNRAKIINMNGRTVLHSLFDINFKYELGQEIEILDFDPCYSHECAPGFHFFMTEKEAKEYKI